MSGPTPSQEPPTPTNRPPNSANTANGSPVLTEVETAEILQSLRDSTAAASTTPATLPSDLALSLDLHDRASYYWDASTMAPLNAASAAAIARLRAYTPPPFPTWDRLPVSRRAAVLILLFADRRGDLRVVITMRAASLRSFSGHAAFPGGKADSIHETPYQIARREAWEEIGLPMDDSKIPRPFRIEPLCRLPCSLAKTELAVRPCVAFLHAEDGGPTADESMMPRLDAKEVAAVFSAPLYNFLKARDLPRPQQQQQPLPPGDWYDGRWLHFHDEPWRVHNFHVPVDDQRVTKPRVRAGGQAALADVLEEEEDAGVPQRFLVWGMTGRMLVDAARIAYGEEPEFEHNRHFGDEGLIRRLEEGGSLPEKKKKPTEVGLEATKEEVKDANL
ncbi:NUDIX hydrolase domain-like protein [Xylariomycetidae sp. FL0641]|nr:NUDIX hydrolase domain-like protein [Xylariomycetidae sp. FL0641]